MLHRLAEGPGHRPADADTGIACDALAGVDDARRTVGCALFLRRTGNVELADVAAHLQRHGSLPELLLLVGVRCSPEPHVPVERGWRSRRVAPGVHVVRVTFGLEDEPDVARATAAANRSLP